MKKYMTIDELSQYLSIKKPTLYAKIRTKGIPYYKIGRLIRFDQKEIDTWVQEKKSSLALEVAALDRLYGIKTR
ncbi:MAG: helix-turn-helix domain-containing protein [Deltaproteobacteria bacterium]|nr:helix-turn-helix domain-containing protein [Deltaproteobacteria bacterium]